MAIQHVLVFGDQSTEKLPSIRKLILLSKKSPSVRRFLKEAADVIHHELVHTTSSERSVFGDFNDVLGLAESYAEQEDPDEVVGSALITIERLGELILYAEHDPTILKSSESRVHHLGFCNGMLPASVAAAARDTSEIFKFGLEIVAISFRLALEVKRRSRLIEDTPKSWGCTLVGPSSDQIQRVLDAFNDQNAIPVHRRVYIGVTSRTWTTVFGPPSVLESLWSQPNELQFAPKLRLPAAVAVHAQHLPPLDACKIIGDSPLLETPFPSKASVLSSSTCKPFEANSLRELLFLIVSDVGQHTLQMEGSIQGLVSSIDKDEEVNLSIVGPTPHVPLVQRSLQNAGATVHLLDAVKAPSVPESVRGGSDLIAVVGMAGRFPGSDGLDDFWEMLQAGVEVHQQIPQSRFNLDDFYDSTGSTKNSVLTQFGSFLEAPGLFDNRFFGVSPREALQMDPLQRLLLMTTYEAMENAGYGHNGSVSTHASRIATYFGQTSEDWRSINNQQGIDIHYVPGSHRAFAPGRLNYHFKWGGGYYSLDTACSSSSTAVLLACSALKERECDTAVVGGGTIITIPEWYSGLSKGGFLSSTGACKTFSDNADGYCRGEGVGVVVLKRLEDAFRDNDNIQAVIRGAARNYNTNSASITQPEAASQEVLLRRILQQSAVNPHDVGFIEMHGTGTQAGDTVEMNSVTKVFAQGRSKDNPLFVGAVKANIGHGEAAAGISSLIKTILMLKNDSIPSQPRFPFEVNHKFPPLEKMNVRIADGKSILRPWHKGDGKRKLIVNNFDAAGGNTTLLIEDAPTQPPKGQDPRAYHVVTCSARTPYSLRENKRRLRDHLVYNEDINIAHLAYSTTARRLHEVYREAYVVRSVDEMISKLDADIDKNEVPSKPSSGRASIVFTFTGQGSQYAGMGRKLYHTSPKFREMLESYQELCDLQRLPSFIGLIRDEDEGVGSKSTVQVQLAIVALEIALAKLWLSWGVEPSLLIGHSLGEYAALCVAGVLSVSDALYLVGRRALLTQERCTAGTHAMLAVGLSQDSIRDKLDEGDEQSCQIACLNGPTTTVLSGKVEEVRSLQQRLGAGGTKATLLEVPYGFHSPQIDPVLQDYERIAAGVHFAKPALPIASTLTGTVVRDPGTFDPAYLVQQARRPVNFVGAVQSGQAEGLINEQSVFLEIGPQPVCLGLVRSCLTLAPSRLLPSLKPGEDDWKSISISIAGAYLARGQVNWPEFHKDYTGCLTVLQLPSYAFELKNYWVPYTREDSAVPKATASPAQAPLSTFSMTCLQRIERASFEPGKISVTFASNTSEPNLYKAIQGHSVNGVALCPASVYLDMASTAAKYILSEINPGAPLPAIELARLEITHALVVTDTNPEQIIRVTAAMSGGDSSIHVVYSSSKGSSSVDHAECWVVLGGQSSVWNSDWERSRRLVQRRVDSLMKSSAAGCGHRLTKALVYKLFSSQVAYGKEYQGLEEVFLDDDFSDAAAIIKLHPASGLGSFTQNPYWMDAVVHLAGFMLNGNFTKPDEEIHISNGLESMRIIGTLSEEHQYTCYVCVRPGNDRGMSLCDVYLYLEDRLVALATGIRFQKMTKAIFAIITGKAASGDPIKQNKTSPLPANASIPPLEREPQVDHSEPTSHSSSNRSTAIITPATSDESLNSAPTLSPSNILLHAVASQIGISASEMEPSTLFADIGVDSIMSIAIISDFKKQTGIELPAAFFNTFSTVGEAQEELGSLSQPEPVAAPAPVIAPSVAGLAPQNTSEAQLKVNAPAIVTTVDSPPDVNQTSRQSSLRPSRPTRQSKSSSRNLAANAAMPQPARLTPFSRAILMQGRSKSTEAPLFLITDGSGSVTAYIHFPPLPNGRRIYALESPFLDRPEEYCMTISEIADLFLAAIRKVQPQGPYMVGGWSAGGVYAYEVSRKLLADNERLLGLLIMDMRVPHAIPDALEPTMELLEQTGLLVGLKRSASLLDGISENQKMHLLMTLKALINFEPISMGVDHRPDHTYVVWASKGLNDTAHGEDQNHEVTGPALMGVVDSGQGHDPEVMEDTESGLKSWFFAKRYSFGPNGWEKLVGDSIECHKIEADHFSMVAKPLVRNLGKLVCEAVERFAVRQAKD